MFDFIFQIIGGLLAFFYEYVPPHNLGVSIILLTFTIMIVLFPLNTRQARSMVEMQRAQPEIKRLQQQYKDDRQKLNEEIMKFYQEHHINPLSGCWPLLVQAPVLLILYRVINDVKGHVPSTGSLSSLYNDACSTSDTLCTNPGQTFLGMDLTKSAKSAKDLVSFGGWLPYLILLVLIVVTGLYQAQQTMARQKKTGSTQMPAQMQIITRVMPVFFGFISYSFASGLVLYWTTRNIWLIGQQHFVIGKIYEEAHAKGHIGAKDAKAADKSAAKGDKGAEATAKAPPAGSDARRRRKKKR